MRARHRHFNPKAAGAATALDGRFTSFANNAAVDTWASRTGSNDVTQSTSANRPTFIASARASQGAIRFDGAASPNTDFLQNSSFVLNQPFLMVSALIQNSNPIAVFFDATTGASRVAFNTNGTGNPADDGKPIIFAGGSSIREEFDARGSWQVYAGIYNGSNSFLYRNGDQKATGNAGANNFATIKVGEFVSGGLGFDGDMGVLCILSGTNQSIRKRLEHAAAYSFKIACS